MLSALTLSTATPKADKNATKGDTLIQPATFHRVNETMCVPEKAATPWHPVIKIGEGTNEHEVYCGWMTREGFSSMSRRRRSNEVKCVMKNAIPGALATKIVVSLVDTYPSPTITVSAGVLDYD